MRSANGASSTGTGERGDPVLTALVRRVSLFQDSTAKQFALVLGVRKKGKQVDNVSLLFGNEPTYILARLKRDRPDPAQLMKWVKEFKHPHEIAGQQSQKIVNEMNWMRARVMRLLPGVAEEQGRHSALRGECFQVTNDNLEVSPFSTIGIQRRLNRDYPALAERAAKSELSAHAAAIEAGFRRRQGIARRARGRINIITM